MKTDIDFKEMMAIGGDTDSDQLAAGKFAKRALEISTIKVNLIEDLLHARTELSASTLREARDAQSTLNQLVTVATEIAQFHVLGNLNSVFSSLHERLILAQKQGKNALVAIDKMFVP